MQKSFTLIEVMLAISVLTIAVGGSFALIQQTLISSSLNQLKLRAYYLGQEGIEIVKNLRDNNWLNPAATWDKGLADGLSVGESRDYIVDFQDVVLEVAPGNLSDQPLNLISSGFYGYAPGEATPFKRKITITKENMPDTLEADDYSLKVQVQVKWSERGRAHNIEIIDYLYNWYGY